MAHGVHREHFHHGEKDQVYALADAIEPRYRGLVLLATFASLRRGELAGLQRRDLDLNAATVRVERQLIQLTGQGLVYTDPKSSAGKRTVVIPELIINELRGVKDFTQDGEHGLIFAGPDDGPLRNTNFNRRICLRRSPLSPNQVGTVVMAYCWRVVVLHGVQNADGERFGCE